jgi:tetratricopeptide (TPR) repeat protein
MTFDPTQRSVSIIPHTIQFVSEYWESRNPAHLLRGVPCILMGLVVLACLWISSEVESRATQRYRTQANHFVRNGDFESATLLFRRIVNRNPSDEDAWFHLAQSISGSGNKAHAEQMMRDIAPRDQRGYRPAHIWLARTRLDSTRGVIPESDFDLILADLLRVQDIPTFKQETAPLLAKLYLQQGRLLEAQPFLGSMAKQGAGQRLAVAKSFQQLGRQEDARREAEIAAKEIAALLKQNPDDDTHRLALAECAVLVQRPEEGEQTLRDGIALDPMGPCRIALAQFYLKWSGQISSDDAKQREQRRMQLLNRAFDLLKRKHDLEPDEQLFAAELALAVGDAESAHFHLKRTHARHLIPRLNLARLFSDQGKRDTSRNIATDVLVYCQNQLRSFSSQQSPKTVALRLHATAAAEILADLPQAITILQQIPESKRSPNVANVLSALYVKQWDQQQLQPDRNSVPEAPVHILLSAFHATPWKPTVVERMLRVARTASPDANRMRVFLQKQLAAGQVPAVAHLLLGTDAMASSDFPRAVQHLELAFALAPEMPQISNNLAWALTHQETPDLDRALDLVDEMLEQFPHLAELLDTRGTIYLKRQQWRQAATDFNRVLSVRPKNVRLHEALAMAYRNLGLTTLAATHEEQAKHLQKTPAPPTLLPIDPNPNSNTHPNRPEIP